MKILVVGLVNNPQLFRVKEEAGKRGHSVDGCYTSDLIIKASNDSFEVSLKNSSSRSTDHRPPITDFDLIYLWSVGKKRWEWYMASYYLNSTQDTTIVNSKVVDDSYKLYLTPAMNYFKQFRESLPFPKTVVIFNTKALPEVVKGFEFPVIIKTSQGRQGRGVFKADNLEELTNKVREMETTGESIILREFIPNDGDIRVFTVGYKAIGAMKRTSGREGEFRSNISQGGTGENYDLSKNLEIKKIAEKLSKITRTEIAGVDIMLNKNTGKPYILEINPGPQFTGFEKYTGINAAEAIIKYLETLKVN